MTNDDKADLDDELTVVYLLGCKDGADKERAAIVAWLRRDIGPWLRDEREEYAVEFAAAIEAGEHLK